MKLIFFFRTSKIFYGQVQFGFLLAPGQVENFTISTPLFYSTGYFQNNTFPKFIEETIHFFHFNPLPTSYY